MALSLREAAAQANTTKSTIWRAIKAGRLSAGRLDDGGYSIDPSEVARCFPPKRLPAQESGHSDTAAVTAAELSGARQLIALLEDRVRDLMTDRDQWRDQAGQATRLLTDQRDSGSRRTWWKRLAG